MENLNLDEFLRFRDLFVRENRMFKNILEMVFNLLRYLFRQ